MLARAFMELPQVEKLQAFLRAEAESGRVAVVIEKDFWVTWILGVIFSDPELEPHFVFKGGTSLSKVYQVIDRFSEDVDLGIHPTYL